MEDLKRLTAREASDKLGVPISTIKKLLMCSTWNSPDSYNHIDYYDISDLTQEEIDFLRNYKNK